MIARARAAAVAYRLGPSAAARPAATDGSLTWLGRGIQTTRYDGSNARYNVSEERPWV